MQTSSLPKRIPTPFADSGSKQDIPVASQIGITGGRASYTDGFPPLTRTPLSAGGIPPFGTDFNGILNDVTAAIRWENAGAGYPFDATFATSIAGYPKGAVIPNSLGDGYWLNITDANTSNPEIITGALTGWVPYETYGVTSITGLAASSVTLTSLQAAKNIIKLSGTLTSNINVVIPAWVRRWVIVNGCTGSYTVTVKTPSGTGVSISSGATANVTGDGTNIVLDSSWQGRMLGAPKVFSTASSYTPSAGTTAIIVQVVGGGGGGGGTPATSSSQNAVGGGGGAGGMAMSYLLVSSLSIPVAITVGIAGQGVVGAAGQKGGTSSFGSYITCTGGNGGLLGAAAASGAPYVLQSPPGGVASGGTYLNVNGSPGGQATFITTSAGISGTGGSSPLGGSGGTGGSTASGGYSNATGPGGGGGGSAAGASASAQGGGAGGAGLILIWELA